MSSLPPAEASNSTGLAGLLGANAGAALNPKYSQSLAAAIITAIVSFVAQLSVFFVLRWRLTRIYRPRTYMVAERQRVPIPPSGPWQWIQPIFTMPNSTVIHKCGLDAYFFLRYLRMLIKIFLPMALVILPILLPINRYSGDGSKEGVNVLGWQNVAPRAVDRLWAHLWLAVASVIWVLYVIYEELRGYIRIRQAYLTSPQHRIRASATTVLVSGIPRKWLTFEALNGLYDVFPGGIRNIWINRDFDELLTKVELRDKYARQLEDAETVLIKKCAKKHKADLDKKAKEKGKSRKERKEILRLQNENDDVVENAKGFKTTDNQHTPSNIQAELGEIEQHEQHDQHHEQTDEKADLKNPLKLVTHGIGALGHGIVKVGQKSKGIVDEVAEDIGHGVKSANSAIDAANAGGGLVVDDKTYDGVSTADNARGQNSATNGIAGLAASKGVYSPQTASGVRAVSDRDNADSSRSSPPRHIDIDVEPPSAEPRSGGVHAGSSATNGHTSLERLQPTQTQPDQPARQGTFKKFANTVKANRKEGGLPFPSPQPHTAEGKEYPLQDLDSNGTETVPKTEQRVAKSKWAEAWGKTQFWKKSGDDGNQDDTTPDYPTSYNEDLAEDQEGEPVWKQYIEPKDRETIRLPIVGQTWFPSLPLMGKKVDRIYHLRKEVARLNAEIETDQDNVERFPLMSSAFIQFNHQVAAHMACQSVSHHIPQHMTPRLVEIAPRDVIWSNMSIKWWERYIRGGLVIAASIGLIILFAIPVSFTGLLANVSQLARFKGLGWLAGLPTVVISIIQGVLPPVLLSLLLALVPVIFGVLVKQQGVATGSEKELGVQQYYFAFLFIQVFLVVTISSGLTSFIPDLARNPASIVQSLSKNLPQASNYFFSYMIVQALGNSASNILQVGVLLGWFILGPLLDSTARAKWRRQTSLPNISWGSYFPPFTNFAVIGLIFSIISPLILVFNVITFTVFWLSQRYNVIYVFLLTNDTGGLLFPSAVNQLFTGLYVMELCLIGLFFIATNTNNNAAAVPQAIIMIVVLVSTVAFQVLMNQAFAPLLRYLPITLEDDAVIRDEAFARALEDKFRGLTQEEREGEEEDDIEDRLESQERRELEADRAAEEAEEQRARDARRSRSRSHSRHLSHHRHISEDTRPGGAPDSNWKTRTLTTARGAVHVPGNTIRRLAPVNRGRDRDAAHTPTSAQEPASATTTKNGFSVQPNGQGSTAAKRDVEAQQQKKLAGDVLFSGFSDELEDLTPEERDTLVRYSFQHAALRARRPVIWIPRDNLGVSDDEIARCKAMSTVPGADGEGETARDEKMEEGKAAGESKTWIWMSNEGTGLDAKSRVVFRRSPPDFASVDLIEL